ncbi:Gfo/Idh/MocA family oxidoreductase [Blautia producta]|nr:Gfo/Idh/MocA family oxidoreductase [Blautia producta]
MISTPNPSHLEMVCKSAEAGKNIICEKPAAMTE